MDKFKRIVNFMKFRFKFIKEKEREQSNANSTKKPNQIYKHWQRKNRAKCYNFCSVV